MAHRVPEGFYGLTREGATGEIGDCGGDHQRHPMAGCLEVLFDGDERGLAVQSVEDGLDHQQVRTSIQQASHCVGVGGLQLVETDVAETRIFHPWRYGSSAVGGSQDTGDETPTAVSRLHPSHFGLREARTFSGAPHRPTSSEISGLEPSNDKPGTLANVVIRPLAPSLRNAMSR